MNKLARVVIMTLVLMHGVSVCSQSMDAGHLYAVLVNGGRNRLTNHERYWNDCSFLYRTLRQTFHIPKRNITVLMSDGGDPGEDMLREDARGFKSSPTDLDGDGQSDVDYAATERALGNVLVSLSKQLTADDHLFLFIVDHGGSKDHDRNSFIWLWDDQQLSDKHLGLLLSLFNIGSVNILMGQCYSGGFIDDLIGNRCIITTACRGDEQSWISPDKPYDEFVYHWTCAVNGADETGNPINADTNGDGKVSMAEAFDYAKSHDRVNETPQYVSQPEELGRLWSFNGIITGIGKSDDSDKPAEIWSLNGVRRQDSSRHGVYILRQGNKTRKVIK